MKEEWSEEGNKVKTNGIERKGEKEWDGKKDGERKIIEWRKEAKK